MKVTRAPTLDQKLDRLFIGDIPGEAAANVLVDFIRDIKVPYAVRIEFDGPHHQGEWYLRVYATYSATGGYEDVVTDYFARVEAAVKKLDGVLDVLPWAQRILNERGEAYGE